jgi:ligand-binding sensor domain-containing protein
MKKLLLALLFLPVVALAQSGNYFLSHYSPGKEHFKNVALDIAQDARGVMYYATNAGVLEFDGKNWDMLKGQSAIYTIEITEQGEIFWGGSKGFGKIGFDNNGFQTLELLSDSTTANIFQAISLKEELYFINENQLFVYNKASGLVAKYKSSNLISTFTNVFELFGTVYISTSDEGILKLDKKNLVAAKLGLTADVVFSSRIENSYVIGLSNNKVVTCNEDLKFVPVKMDDQAYADASVVISGSWINRQLLALGTLRGGAIFVNPITGHTQEIVNYDTGLPDNEVFALAPDRNQNIWIAHEYGFTRVSPYLAFRSFSHYPGIDGNLLCAFSHNGSVYAGTSVGLYKLQKEDVYDDLVYFVNVPVAAVSKSSAKNELQNPSVQQSKEQPETKRKGLFNFLKKNKNKATTQTDESSSGAKTESIKQEETGAKFKQVKRTQKVLRASQYSFKRVKGIDAKISHLLQVNGKLIASGLGGVYEVNDLQAKAILEEPVRTLYPSQHKNILYVSTYQNEVRTLTYNSKGWTPEPFSALNEKHDQVNFIFESADKELWLCGLDKVYQYKIEDEDVSLIQSLSFDNPDMEATYGVTWDSEVLFVNPQGFYAYDKKTKKAVKVDSLQLPAQYFPLAQSIIYRDQHGWNLVGKRLSQVNLHLLNLFHDLRFVGRDQVPENLWIVSGGNELYKFFGEKLAADEKAFPLFLKSITNDQIKIASADKINISEDKSSVLFEIVQPDYISPQSVEFRFQLKGMNDQWTEWAVNNSNVGFPYLPPGEYVLNVQSRNIFGKVTDLDPMTFQVLPPYWRRSWFYAMEFAFLATLVLLSVRLNERYRLVSRILSLLTIILLIQFIQTLIDSIISFKESPVIDFIIQVIVAFLILPVEGFLHDLMTKSLDGSSKLYQFIAPKNTTGYIEIDKGAKLEAYDSKEE